jgi:hypothetical protein
MPLSTSEFTHYYNDGSKEKSNIETFVHIFGRRATLIAVCLRIACIDG